MTRHKAKSPKGTNQPVSNETETENETTESEEDLAGTDEDSDETEEEDDVVLTPLPVKAEPKAISKKPRRNLGGVYKTKNQIRFNDEYQPPGTVLTFTDAEARHFLKFNAVEAVEDDE